VGPVDQSLARTDPRVDEVPKEGAAGCQELVALLGHHGVLGLPKRIGRKDQ